MQRLQHRNGRTVGVRYVRHAQRSPRKAPYRKGGGGEIAPCHGQNRREDRQRSWAVRPDVRSAHAPCCDRSAPDETERPAPISKASRSRPDHRSFSIRACRLRRRCAAEQRREEGDIPYDSSPCGSSEAVTVLPAPFTTEQRTGNEFKIRNWRLIPTAAGALVHYRPATRRCTLAAKLSQQRTRNANEPAREAPPNRANGRRCAFEF